MSEGPDGRRDARSHDPLQIVLIGLSVTSSWGNGHATNYRGLMKELSRRGHEVTFLERDVEWYAAHRDLPVPPYGTTHLYASTDELRELHSSDVRDADLVVIGSYVPDGIAVSRWALEVASGVTAFYDIDTPVTLATLENGSCEYLSPALVGEFDVYLSFTGGPTLDVLERRWGARSARAFYCMVDEDAYGPVPVDRRWALGYLGTYSPDRQPAVDSMLIASANAMPEADFVVGGPGYPGVERWPSNVGHIDHLPPAEHPAFYAAQGFTLNVTRVDMIKAGWSPSVRLFEASACGVPVISDRWQGLDAFFVPGEEILIADSTEQVTAILRSTDAATRDRMGAAARAKVLQLHTARHRAQELEQHVVDARQRRSVGRVRRAARDSAVAMATGTNVDKEPT